MEQEISNLQGALKITQKDNNAKSERLQKKSERLQKKSERLQKADSDYKKDLSEKTDIITTLKQKLNFKTATDADLASSQEQVKELTKQISELKQTLLTKETQLQNFEQQWKLVQTERSLNFSNSPYANEPKNLVRTTHD